MLARHRLVVLSLYMGLAFLSCAPPSPPPQKPTPPVPQKNAESACASLACIEKGEVCCVSTESISCMSSEQDCARPDPPVETWFYSCLSPADCQGEPCVISDGFRGFKCSNMDRFDPEHPNDVKFACRKAQDCPKAAAGWTDARCEQLPQDESYSTPSENVCIYSQR
jgi:hypothetical protein